ncbi:hypothetical protein [Pseudomonas sp. CHM02]|uniref:hypothetical protein n=1 Tax=Pseudomonas sp. CHM02 TaxID=1463662 RepID=UPI0004727816|nr:hypothetical protein [Pseudomonas sp. CHM02]
MTDMKIVTFKQGWRGYAVGEVAGFDSAAADALIESGRAKLYVEKAASGKAAKTPAGKKSAAKKPADQKPSQQEEQEEQEEQENEEIDEKP